MEEPERHATASQTGIVQHPTTTNWCAPPRRSTSPRRGYYWAYEGARSGHCMNECLSKRWEGEIVSKKCKKRNEPHGPVLLHDAPHRHQPSLSHRKHKKPDARSSHRSRGTRSPGEKPQIVANREVQIHDHVSHFHGHASVHFHIHAIIVSESTRNQ